MNTLLFIDLNSEAITLETLLNYVKVKKRGNKYENRKII